MKTSPFSLALLATVLLLAPGGKDAAEARQLKVDYSVSIRGLPVGQAKLRAHVDDGRYAISLLGRVSGLVRLFTDIEANARADGTIGEDRPLARGYEHEWVEDGETETVAMHYSGRGVDEIDLDPPIRRPERYVPMTDEQKADALDLVSAFLWPAPGGATPAACDRTLPLIDGKRRFDIDFAFDRTDSFVVRRGHDRHKAVVCSIRYRPVAGHRKDKKNDGFLSESGDMEVWLSDIGDGILLPIRVLLQSKLGPAVLAASRFEAE
jgi:hypothetical protein